MAGNSIIRTGNTFRIFDDSVQTYDTIPPGTYKVQFNPFAGYSLLKTDELEAGNEKVYGSHDDRLDRITAAYEKVERSLGVLMSGDKGMGKSLMIRLISERFREQLGLPVIIVDEETEGLPDFIDSLGECVVVFDEFEKKFSAQEKFLGLFDGMSNTKRTYVVTCNNVNKLSDFFVNRPGRFHYHIRFDYPDAEAARIYLTEQAPSASQEQIDAAVTFARRIKLNYDHLRAIAFELELGGKFRDVIGDLNIKNIDPPNYKLVVRTKDGRTFTETDDFGLHEDPTSDYYEIPNVAARQQGGGAMLSFKFDPARLVDGPNSSLAIDPRGISELKIVDSSKWENLLVDDDEGGYTDESRKEFNAERKRQQEHLDPASVIESAHLTISYSSNYSF